VSDIFHEERWDYVFVRQRANSQDIEQRRIAVFFEDGKRSAWTETSSPRPPEARRSEARHRRSGRPHGARTHRAGVAVGGP